MMNYQLIQTVTEKAKGKAERKRQEKKGCGFARAFYSKSNIIYNYIK